MDLEFLRYSESDELLIPIFEDLRAGFPSPASDFSELAIDLNQELVKHKEATFYARVKGDSMIDAGISEGDVLVIDRSLDPEDNKIAVCFVDGEFTVKRLKVDKEAIWLVPENESYPPIRVTEENNFIVWGIVTYIIKKA